MSRLHAKTYDSISHDYTTPEDFVDIHLQFLDRESYDIDAACLYPNIPAEIHFLPYVQPWSMSLFGDLLDGLKQEWYKLGKCVFLNPPYGNLLIKFVKKAFEEAQKGCDVWLLLPTRFVQYYFDYIYKVAGFVYFMPEKRFEFLINGHNKGKAPMPLCLVYLGKNADYYTEKWVKEDPYKNTQYEGALMRVLKIDAPQKQGVKQKSLFDNNELVGCR